MPVNKHIGKLWFESQEEIDEYDDLMVSNIELKSPDFDSPHFTILSLRDRKEIVPGVTDKVRDQIQAFDHFMRTTKPKKTSFTGFWELPFYKYVGGLGLSYLLIREMPIRNFYARAFIMAFYLNSMRSMLWPELGSHGTRSALIFNGNSEFLWANQQAVHHLRDH